MQKSFVQLKQQATNLFIEHSAVVDSFLEEEKAFKWEQEKLFDQIYKLSSDVIGQNLLFAKTLKNQQARMKSKKKAQQQNENWQALRAMKYETEKQRNQQLKRTLKIFKKNQARIEQSIEQFKQEQRKLEKTQEIEETKTKKKKQLTNLSNRPLRKGIETNLDENEIKITVQRQSNLDLSLIGLVEYVIRIEKGRYIPAKKYSQPAYDAILDYNFHHDLPKLYDQLKKVSIL